MTTPAAQAQPRPVSAPTPDVTPARTFHLTPMAARKLYENLRKRGTPDAALRVGVRGGGCSGFSYVLEFADGPPRENRDLVFTFDVERKDGDEQDPGRCACTATRRVSCTSMARAWSGRRR